MLLNLKDRLYRITLIILFSIAPVLSSDIEILWIANTEPDLAGYKIYYGNTSGNYDKKIDIGNKTITIVSNLEDQIEYYFSLTAYDSAGNESGFSKEASCVLNDNRPLLVDSIKVLSPFDIAIFFNKKVDPVSSQHPANYSIDGGIQIYKALLRKDGKTVRLITSEHQFDKNYTLVISNVLDISLPSNMITKGSLSYQVIEKKLDVTPPAVILLNAVSPTNIDIYFNEPMSSVSATDIKNYTIDNNINVISAVMQADNIVRLETSPQSVDKIFTITLNNLYDKSDNKNSIQANSAYQYSYTPGDVKSPAVTLIHLPGKNNMDIMFNEPVTKKSAETITNYSINGGIQIIAAQLDSNQQTVHFQTTEHRTDRLYAIKVNQIRDSSPFENRVSYGMEYTYLYQPPDRIPPIIRTVEVIDNTHINIIFSEKVDKRSAELPGNYIINSGVQVLEAQLALTDNKVRLLTTPHVLDKINSLSIKGVRDCSINANEIDDFSSFQYTVESNENKIGPLVVKVEVMDSTTLNVYFNNPLDSESAQNINNYSLDNDLGIISANLNNTINIVKLQTTPQKAGIIYTLSTSGIYLSGHNGSYQPPSNKVMYIYKGVDNIGPVITMIKPIDNENIDVLFSETLAESEAEKPDNYRIIENIHILEARLDATKHIVHLRTEPHTFDQKYTLQINNITDNSPKQNLCRPNTLYTYTFTKKDKFPPYIKMVKIIDSEFLEIHFSEHVNEKDILVKNNYLIDNDVEIISINAGSAKNIVEINTSLLDPGTLYNLQVKGIRDLSDNIILENIFFPFYYQPITLQTGPQLTQVIPIKDNELVLNFNKKLSKQSAEDVGNYKIDGNVNIISAELQTLTEQVKLRTSRHQIKQGYVIETSNITGVNDEKKSRLVPFNYYLDDSDIDQLVVVNVEFMREDIIEIAFNKSLDVITAESIDNYEISPALKIYSAYLDVQENKVVLETSKHIAGIPYTVKIDGVKVINNNSTEKQSPLYYTYSYMPSLRILIDGFDEQQIEKINIGKKYYVDRNYVITAIPNEIKNATMIKTPNNDKDKTNEKYLTLHLTTDAMVYIAYDSRAISFPEWLQSKFIHTKMELGVSDPVEKLTIWKGLFEAGEVVLGGNNAKGASEVRSMYLVLVDEANIEALSDEKPPETPSSTDTKPRSFMLHQNYPNPFNPETTIRFEISTEMYVQLEIYDILGRKVKTLFDSKTSSGFYNLIWNGLDEYDTLVSTGIYFYRLNIWESNENDSFTKKNFRTLTKKMMFLK